MRPYAVLPVKADAPKMKPKETHAPHDPEMRTHFSAEVKTPISTDGSKIKIPITAETVQPPLGEIKMTNPAVSMLDEYQPGPQVHEEQHYLNGVPNPTPELNPKPLQALRNLPAKQRIAKVSDLKEEKAERIRRIWKMPTFKLPHQYQLEQLDNQMKVQQDR